MLRFQEVMIFLISIIGVAIARDVVKLEAVNFELAITSYPYVAILFYDGSEESKVLESNWETAARELGDFYMDGEMGKINTADPEVKEVMDAYRLSSPSIKVFRRGSMADYRGPGDAKGILEYIKQDSQPSVVTLSTLDDVKSTLEKKSLTIVLGFFSSTEASVDSESADVYSLDSWGQFQAAADALRSHAAFYVISSESVMKDFGVKVADTPLIYLIPVESEGLLAYSGEYLEAKIIEWVLRNSAPSVGELTFTSTAGEVYATQFFSSKLYKFILFLPPGDRYKHEDALANWKNIASGFKKKAIFSYIIGNTVQDVLDYFDVDLSSDVPVIVGHNPNKDQKYKSSKKIALTTAVFQEFVSGVLGGKVSHVSKSEPVPKTQKGNVIKAVGTTVISIVNQTDKDVLLEVYAPWCGHCKQLAPTYEILGKAVQAESRIVIAKIDGSANDLPPSWGVKNFPTLLWFPASSKPYKTAIPVPKPYWDAGTSLQELVNFVVREGSFDSKSLKVATSEQLGSLFGEEETLRELYEKEDRWTKRNEGRKINDNKFLDYIHGEIVFDGKRSYIIGAGGIILILLSCCFWLTFLLMKKNSGVRSNSSSSPKKKNI